MFRSEVLEAKLSRSMYGEALNANHSFINAISILIFVFPLVLFFAYSFISKEATLLVLVESIENIENGLELHGMAHSVVINGAPDVIPSANVTVATLNGTKVFHCSLDKVESSVSKFDLGANMPVTIYCSRDVYGGALDELEVADFVIVNSSSVFF